MEQVVQTRVYGYAIHDAIHAKSKMQNRNRSDQGQPFDTVAEKKGDDAWNRDIGYNILYRDHNQGGGHGRDQDRHCDPARERESLVRKKQNEREEPQNKVQRAKEKILMCQKAMLEKREYGTDYAQQSAPYSGTIKWFDQSKGFGFVILHDSPEELYFNESRGAKFKGGELVTFNKKSKKNTLRGKLEFWASDVQVVERQGIVGHKRDISQVYGVTYAPDPKRTRTRPSNHSSRENQNSLFPDSNVATRHVTISVPQPTHYGNRSRSLNERHSVAHSTDTATMDERDDYGRKIVFKKRAIAIAHHNVDQDRRVSVERRKRYSKYP